MTTSRPKPLGFTLVEVLIAATLVVVAMAATLQFFLSSMDTYGVAVGNLVQNGDLRQFCQQITRDGTRAQAISLVSNDQVLLTMRDGSTVTYTRAGGTSFGSVTRLDSTTGRSTVVADRIRPPLSGSFFSVRQTGNGLLVQGRVSSRAQSIRAPELNSTFEFLVARRG